MLVKIYSDYGNEYEAHDTDGFRVKKILDKAGKAYISELDILGITNGQDTAMIALSRDPVELLLISYKYGGECYELFSDSDAIIFYDGEMGVGNINWLDSENILVFYKYYIVHDMYRKVVVSFDDRNSFFINEKNMDADRTIRHPQNYHFL